MNLGEVWTVVVAIQEILGKYWDCLGQVYRLCQRPRPYRRHPLGLEQRSVLALGR